MTEEEYKKLFEDVRKKEQQGFGVSENNIPQHQNPYTNINEVYGSQPQQYQSLNETPDVSQYKIDENLNGGWGTNEFQVETRINGVEQQNSPFQHQQRKKPKSQDLNGLEQFLVGDEDKNLNEVVQHNDASIKPVDDSDSDVMTLEMFKQMSTNAMLTLNNKMFRS